MPRLGVVLYISYVNVFSVLHLRIMPFYSLMLKASDLTYVMGLPELLPFPSDPQEAISTTLHIRAFPSLKIFV